MSLGDWLYYGFSAGLWLYLASLTALIWRKDFIVWLGARPKACFYLVGVDHLPDSPEALLRKFYGYLFGGWSWILLWAWWIMPQLKEYFFRSISNEISFKVARLSTLVVVIAYAAAGFFALAKAITIWYRNIYRPGLSIQPESRED